MSKKKPLETKYSIILDKLFKLKYLINDAYRDGAPGLLPDKSDKDFVIGLINNIRNETNLPVSRIQLEECNEIWKRYAK